MKILHITKKYPNALGGDAVVVSNLQKCQMDAGHQVAVVTSRCDEVPEAEHLYKVGLKDTPSGLDKITPRRMCSLLALALRMFGIIKKERPTIIHTHSIDMAFFASFAARFYGIPMVHTFHIVTFYDNSQPSLRRKSELWLARHACLRSITAPNKYDVKKLQSQGLEQAVVLPNGVDLEQWETCRLAAKHHDFTFLAIGRLEDQKGNDYLIKAAALLAKKTSANFKVIIVGDGSQRDKLKQLARAKGIHSIVTFLGQQSQAKIRALLARADVMVIPSLYETTPLTLLEAWASATPTIATAVGILREVPAAFKAARIVRPQNAKALMDAMAAFMADTKACQTASKYGNQEVKKYAWPLISVKAESIYRSAI
jgi:glycosyltransferase involved in cell wall biosynthesis